MRRAPRAAVLAATAGAVAALAGARCGSGGPSSGVTVASVRITSPESGATVSTDANARVPVAFSVEGFTLMQPGRCAGAPSCGHVHLMVDGSACNDRADGSPFNVWTSASPALARLELCPMVTGAHTFTTELHNDDHSLLRDAQGSPVAGSVTAMVVAGGAVDGGAPGSRD